MTHLVQTRARHSPPAARLVALFGGSRPLVFPSAWDAGTARAACRAGAAAVAVRATDLAWSFGLPRDVPAPGDQLLGACERIRRVVDVPVVVDVSDTATVPAGARGDVLRALAAMGIAGLTIAGDDALGVLERRDAACAFVEVRLDAEPHVPPEEARRRAHAYVAAGADGVLLSSRDVATIAPIAGALGAPVSVDVGDDWAPPVWALARLGVRGVRLGGAPLHAACRLIDRVTAEALRRGTYDLVVSHTRVRLSRDDTQETR